MHTRQWKAHGRYIARESASQGRGTEAGFDATERGINIAARLDQWQSAGDARLWKLILSPEFGDKIDLIRLTRDLTKRMARDLDTGLEWVAVSHFNTDNPHVPHRSAWDLRGRQTAPSRTWLREAWHSEYR